MLVKKKNFGKSAYNFASAIKYKHCPMTFYFPFLRTVIEVGPCIFNIANVFPPPNTADASLATKNSA